ncbi:GSCOCT00009603001.2-RA-CDS [Cotesia congregata]|uniref:Venom protein 7 n=1 Tax=Cotesia congregata TaxID=51543 RepID=A0A8J2H564_COTCN|nr:GSCOCT00009603001.2-RA-CDS [Cotesia congregata]CAG5075118.1 Putative venom protein 7 [Cotesia congregata]
MLSSKSLLLLLVAVLGSSWIFDGGSNGVAYACWSSSEVPQTEVTSTIQCPGKKQVIYKINLEYEEFTPLTVGIWIGETYYRLPIAPYYIIEIKNGMDLSTYHIYNVFYRGETVAIRD